MATSGERDLKLYVFAHGLYIDPAAEKAWIERFRGPLSLSEYASTSGVCLYTESDVYINAPFIESFTQGSEASLIYRDGFLIAFRGDEYPVGVVPVPAYHQQSYVDDGVSFPYTNLGVTHTDRCRISPIEGCAWRCKFCDLPYEFKYRKKPADELLEVIRIAANDPLAPARHVLISGGTPKPVDEGWIDGIYERIARESPLPVDVMMPARPDFDYPAWLRSVGVNMLSVNLEINDVNIARKITPNKARQLGRELYLNYIARAVDVFGVGQVQSLLIVGESAEPLESTLEGVRELVDRGCVPVLSPFRPDPHTPMATLPPPSVDEMQRVYDATLKICAKAGSGLLPGPRCVPCQHNTIAFPDSSDFYVPLGRDLTLACAT